jgi:sigma-B regulation protein RsbU (phosphoserine phosphatase)
MRYANAGHPKPLHVRRGAGLVEPLNNAAKKSQPVLGLFEKGIYQTSEVTLAPQDLVMLFTDGLYEVQSPSQELYTQEMLAAGVRTAARGRAVVRRTAGSPRSRRNINFADDVCLVGMELATKSSG